MRRRGPTWENYDKTIAEAKAAQQELAQAQKEMDELKKLNKQMLTEMQVESRDPVVPVSEAKFINGLGKFMVPVEDTLTNHFRLIYDRSNELDFWPEQSPAFDGVVAQTFLDQAFSSPSHPRYFDYEPLRDNVATVRNYVMHAVLNGVDPSNKKQLEKANKTLEQMGREIGVALQRDSLFRRPGSDHVNVRAASVPGAGAAELYALLVKKQQKNKFMHTLKSLFGFNYGDWNLLPVEKSPFSKGHVDTFCLGDFSQPDNPSHLTQTEVLDVTRAAREARRKAEATLAQQEAEMVAAGLEPAAPADSASTAETQSNGLTSAQQISVLGAAIAGSAFSLDRVKRLPTPVKQRSVEIARDILDKLRIDLGTSDNTQWLTFPTEQAALQGEAISSLSALYGESYQAALVVDPQLKNDPAMQAGNEAIGKLAYLMKLQSSYKLLEEGRMDEAQMVLAETDQYPEAWKQVEGVRVSDLLDQVQYGLERTHSTVQQALQQHSQIQAELAQQSPDSNGPRPRAEAPAPNAAPMAPASQILTAAQPAAVNGTSRADLQQLHQLLQDGSISKDIANMRDMQTQAATMPQEDLAQQLKHANTVVKRAAASPANPAPQQGNYRTAVQGQSRESTELLKR